MIVADKIEDTAVVTRRDLVALQRVAQSLGLALDKKAQIEAEVRARKIFQKFVPSAVVASTLGDAGPKLGGESKDVVCLFLDIRDFTLLSNQLPSEILVDLLNQIFQIVHECVSAAGGVIDKFIGDGVLVHWGAIPGSDVDPSRAVASAEMILERIDQLNEANLNRGFNPIEIGVGIHRGAVTVGNIGAQERMEFTIVGSEVNFASRLEGLNKVFKSNIVISQSILDAMNLGPRWEIHEGIQIRGVTSPVRIACLKHQTSADILEVSRARSISPDRDSSESFADKIASNS